MNHGDPAFRRVTRRDALKLAGTALAAGWIAPDAFAAKLGDRVRLRCPITRIEHGGSGVTVYFQNLGGERKLEAHPGTTPGQAEDPFLWSYADNTSGMEAATRPAHRVARQIDEA